MSKSASKSFDDLYSYVGNSVKSLNDSKFFAGIMIVLMNIASKFVTIKISKSMEAYLKYTFSRNLLIFTISWIGSRDLFVAFGISFLFIFCIDYLLNEDSQLCILPSSFIEHHNKLITEDFITKEELDKAMSVLDRIEKKYGGNSGSATMMNNMVGLSNI